MTYQSGAFRGNACLSWVDADDVNVERVLLLREPLRELRPATKQAVYTADSLDYSQRQTFYIGQSVDELVGKIRFMDDPQGLIDLIKAGSKQRTITYIPNLADPNRNFACYLIKPLNPAILAMDATAGVTYGLREVEITLRQTNGKAFDLGWAYETGMFLRYIAGGRLKDATYSRASSAGAINKFAILSTTIAANTARIQWTGPPPAGGIPTLLLEAAATNLLVAPEDLTNASWTKVGTTIPSTNNTSPRNDATADFVREDASTGTHGPAQVFSIGAAGHTVGIAAFFRPLGRTKVKFLVVDNATGLNAFGVELNTATATGAAITSGAGVLTFKSNVIVLGSLLAPWYWVQCYGTVDNTHTQLQYTVQFENGAGQTSYTGDSTSGMAVWGCVATDATATGSYWGTGASRSADVLSVPWNFKPQAGWFYCKFIEWGTAFLGAQQRILHIADSATTAPALRIQASSSKNYTMIHDEPGGNTVTSGFTITHNVGDTVELLGLLYSDGSVELISAVNGGAQSSAGRSAALALGAGWSATTLNLNGVSTNAVGLIGLAMMKAGIGTTVNTMLAAQAA